MDRRAFLGNAAKGIAGAMLSPKIPAALAFETGGIVAGGSTFVVGEQCCEYTVKDGVYTFDISKIGKTMMLNYSYSSGIGPIPVVLGKQRKHKFPPFRLPKTM